jgi:hypothetical protein
LDKDHLRILFIGDVIGEPGRKAIFVALSDLMREKKIDFVIANGENASGGFGITGEIAGKLTERNTGQRVDSAGKARCEGWSSESDGTGVHGTTGLSFSNSAERDTDHTETDENHHRRFSR